MTLSRRLQLENGEDVLTELETTQGWHFCKGNHGRLVGPGMDESMTQCECEIERCYYEDHMQSRSHHVIGWGVLAVIAAAIAVGVVILIRS